MELRHLRYFLALAERLHFGQAAELAHITQSTLSHQIKQLEDELGYRLFDREHGRVSLTAKGALFCGYVSNAVLSIDEGVRVLKQSSGSMAGELRIGAGHCFSATLIPECVRIFAARHPAVKLIFDDLRCPSERLVAGELDLAIGYRLQPADGVRFESLYCEELKLVVPARHPWFRRRRIRMVELSGQRMVSLGATFAVRAVLDECLQSAGATPLVVAETNDFPTMFALLDAMGALAISAEHPAIDAEGHAVIPLENPTPMREFGLMWRDSVGHSIAIHEFAQAVREAAFAASLRQSNATGRMTSRPSKLRA